ncbi:MAG: hypothetical protein PVJ57_23005 [Phycisphaerae bacterium]|jgi:hypothetical protein
MRRYLIVLFVVLLGLAAGCNREDAESFIKEGLSAAGPSVLAALNATYADPTVRAAFAQDGWEGVKRTGGGVMLLNLKNEFMSLAEGDEAERKLYEWTQDHAPTFAAMIYRETEAGPQGIWPRLDVLARQAGYDSASLHLAWELTPEQWDYLLQRAPRVIVEEYEAVTGEPISESLLTGIETGGEW